MPCELIIVSQMKKNLDIIPFINSIIVKNEWDDLLECFIQKNNLCIVLKCHEYNKLLAKIKQNEYSLHERAHIFKNLCETIMIQDAPHYIIYDGLKKEHLVINDSLEVSMRYGLEYLADYAKYTMADVNNSLLYWFRTLFKKEIKQKFNHTIPEFVKMLKENELYTYLEIYEAYLKVYSELKEQDNVSAGHTKHSLKYIVFYICTVLVLAVLISIYLYLQYDKSKPRPPVGGLDRIGSVEIIGDNNN